MKNRYILAQKHCEICHNLTRIEIINAKDEDEAFQKYLRETNSEGLNVIFVGCIKNDFPTGKYKLEIYQGDIPFKYIRNLINIEDMLFYADDVERSLRNLSPNKAKGIVI